MVIQLKYGSGLGRGISSLGASIGGALKERREQSALQNILNPPEDTAPQQDVAQDEGFRQNFLDMVQTQENETGEMMTPEQLDMAWNATTSQATKQQQAQRQQSGAPRKYSMKQLAAIAKKNQPLASMLQQNQLAQEKMEQRGLLASEERAFKDNKPYFEKIDKMRDTLPDQEVALMRINDAMASGDIKNLRNYAADFFGNEYLRSASLNDLNSAVKEFFLADVQKMPSGTRLNQFIEKNLFGALQSGGKSEESNQKISEYQRFKIDIGNKEVEISDKLREKYLNAGREPPIGFAAQVSKQLKTYVQERQKELIKNYKNINDGKYKSRKVLKIQDAKSITKNNPPKAGFTWMLSPKGEPKQIPTKHVARMQDLGGELIK